ncbi:phosphoenolpyruvate carboxykinase (GTP), partial [bacterium]|nr:phosphoenolpyruvate carboxykinase (GTP) [bacterium]
NVLLGKKCLALRIASHLGHQEGWMAEHMLIMGIEHPDGRIDYVAGAFPSACGKTNLAMLVPPKDLADAGYKVWTLGDDIAWMRVGDDGRLWAINPESGCFGVVPGTNSKSNPSAMEMVKTNTIYTNTMLADDGTTWWEGHDEDPPAHGLDWKGEEWVPGKKDDHGHAVPGAHPNSRFTAPMSQCPSVAPNWEDPKGVPISAIMFGARRARLAPLIVESSSWEHAVYLGANMTSERTAAQRGTVGEVRRDPMAMLPFCGYNMADYFQHWLDMGKRLTQQPKVFRVNWFRCSEEGEFLWPGFGENLRVLLWMLARARGEADAVESPIGNVPTYESFEWAGLDYARETFEELMDIDVQEWLVEDAENKQFLAQFGDRLPQELREQHAAREQRLRDAD